MLGSNAADMLSNGPGQPPPPPRMAPNGRGQPPPPPPSQATATFQARQQQPKKLPAAAMQRGPRCYSRGISTAYLFDVCHLAGLHFIRLAV